METSLYRLPQPSFGSDLTSLLFEVERLRAEVGSGLAHNEVQEELLILFQTVTSVVSARIEGNHTTIYEAVAGRSAGGNDIAESSREILNIEEAATFIDSLSDDVPFTHGSVHHVHRVVVAGLRAEGDRQPGKYRDHDVAISGSSHVPPASASVHAYMSDLFDFANERRPAHEQMLQIALAHHRFVWIHPFGNGNGRVARLFTYWMLRKLIFDTHGHSALNPAAVFGNDRSEYMRALEAADPISAQGDLEWAQFFVQGIRDDLERVVRLGDHNFLRKDLLDPVIDTMEEEGILSRKDAQVLRTIATLGTVKSGDLVEILGENPTRRSRELRRLLDRGLVTTADRGPRFYRLSLSSGPLAAFTVRRLNQLDLLPKMLAND